MKDMIPKGTGNSRFLRSVSNFKTIYPTYDDFVNALVAGNLPVDFNGINEAGIQQVGTPLNKANLLADETAALLGLGQNDPTVNDALNVLANIGNVHVWQRVQTYADPVPEVPAGYTLGDVEENVVLASRSTTVSTKGTFYYYYGDSVTVKNDGTVNAPSSDSWATIGRNVSATTLKSGPLFVKGSYSYISSGSGYQDADVTNEATKVFYIPSGGTLSVTVDSNAKMCYVVATKYQPVTGYPYTPAIPAGTHVDYLTSTDPNAYPKQSAEGGQDAYYSLGDVVSNYDLGQSGSNILVTYSSDIVVSYDGVVTMVEPNSLSMVNIDTDVASTFSGKFVKTSINDSVVFIPVDATASYDNSSGFSHVILSKYQPVTGYPAIPANTVITYLGQLGEPGAKIEVGSYVGTGTSRSTITLGYKPDFLAVFYKGQSGTDVYYHGFALPDFPWATSNVTMLAITETGFTVRYNAIGGSLSYLNNSGVTYGYIAFRKG